jgi:hypothetical protein
MGVWHAVCISSCHNAANTRSQTREMEMKMEAKQIADVKADLARDSLLSIQGNLKSLIRYGLEIGDNELVASAASILDLWAMKTLERKTRI